MESDKRPDWLLYEHQMVERHAAAHFDADVFHWTHVPEPMLEESGYIHDRNQWRLERKRKHEDPNPLSDYGRHRRAFETAEETWRRSLEATAAFIIQNGRSPSSIAKDPVEKRLGSWVSNQKHNYGAKKNIMKTAAVRAEWAALVGRHPRAFETADKTWRRSLE